MAHPDKTEPPAGPAPEWIAEISTPYLKPLTETYTEMRDLLLLDPIHDVAMTGWPHLPETAPEQP